MGNYENIEAPVLLRKMTESDLSAVLTMRNQPEVRRYMFTRDLITPAQHQRWFKRMQDSVDSELLVLQRSDVLEGFVQFKNASFTGVVDWGFYTSVEASKGTGKLLGSLALAHIFADKTIHKVCGQALGFNKKSIQFHKSLGFAQEGILKDHYYDGEDLDDLFCFGLTRPMWHNSRERK